MNFVSDNLKLVRQRIDGACAVSQRPAGSVQLLAVSKNFDAATVQLAIAAGLTDFGENYLQEGLAKIAALPRQNLNWHFIGPIQSNKTRDIAEHFDWVHSVDRLKIAQRLSDQRPADLPPLNVCVQVNISGEASKSGCAPDEALELCRSIAALPRLQLRGLMAIPAPFHSPYLGDAIHGATSHPSLPPAQPSVAGRSPGQVSTGHLPDPTQPFRALRELFEHIKNDIGSPPGFDTLSAGMSDDLEAAIAEGSTMVRIGTAIFGKRHPKT